MNDSGIDARTTNCLPFSIGELFGPRESPRTQVTVTSFLEMDSATAGLIIDKSSFGLRLVLAAPIPAGMPVAVEWGDTLMFGVIVYCVRNCSGYHAAVKTTQNFVPTGMLRGKLPAAA